MAAYTLLNVSMSSAEMEASAACIQALQRLFKILRLVQNVQRFADGQGFIRRVRRLSVSQRSRRMNPARSS